MQLFKSVVLFILYVSIGLFTDLLIASEAYADYYFKQISIKQGLSQSKVTAIACDQRGNVWIGTGVGLNRYAEGIVCNYFNKPDDPTSLPDNEILFIHEGQKSDLWIGTAKGLTRYCWDTDRFERFFFNGNPIQVSSAHLLNDGILFGGDGEIFRYSAVTQRFSHTSLESETKFPYRINTIYPLNKTKFYLGTRYNGVWIYDLETQKRTILRQYENKNISTFYVDTKGNLWSSPYGEGLFCHSPSGKELAHYNCENSSLTNNIILDIKGHRGDLWIATDGGGINILNPKKGKMEAIMHIPGDIYSLPANSINILYYDKQDYLWAGSVREGLVGIRKVYTKSFHEVALGNGKGLSSNTVICIYEENDSILWIGTDGGGVNRFNIYRRTFTHYPDTYSMKVVSIVNFSPTQLLLSLFDAGLVLFDKRTHQLIPFPIVNDAINKQETNTGKSINLFRQGDDLYILSNHIYKYQLKTHHFEKLSQQTIEAFRISPMQPIEITENEIYMMSQSDIFSLSHESEKLKEVYRVSNEQKILNACCCDEEGLFWLGTPQGLYRLNANTSECQLIPTILFQSVTSLLSDKNGRIWIGAQNQLFCYISKENRFETFGESDGVSPNELFSSANLLSRSGHLLMGGAGGLIFINKSTSILPSVVPSIQLSELVVNGRSIINQQEGQKALTLPYDFSLLEVKVLVQEDDLFRKRLYRYHIEGLDTHYTESYSSTLNLRTLPSGDYTINVQCLLRDGNWTPMVMVLKFSVSPPWWRSTFFILLVIASSVGIFFVIFYTIVRRKVNRLAREKQDHEQLIYEEKVRFLINLSNELRTPLTLIYGPLKRLLSPGQPPPADLHGQLMAILKQTKVIRNTIDMVLDVRRMELGHEKLQLSLIHLATQINEVVNDFRSECETRNIMLDVNNDPQMNTIAVDPNKFNIILSNLLSNAVKFSPQGGKITITMLKEKSVVRISVADQGTGLKDVDLSRLFVRFYQGKHGLSGSGIGLSYSKLLIEMHGGTISASDLLPHGADFSFTLPLQAKEEVLPSQPYLNQILSNQEVSNPQSSKPITINTTCYRLLIVESNIEMCEFIRVSLAEHFNYILTVHNGTEALKLVEVHKPDVIVSDLSLPEMNGYELCKKIKSNMQTAHVPFILLSAQTDDESVSIGYHLGVDAYLPKPFDIELLFTLIVKQISNREILRQHYSGIQTVENSLNNADEMFLLKFNQSIMGNISDPTLDINLLCRLMGMSRSSLYNKVKLLTGVSTKEYLNKVRIDRAISLLTTTSLSISEISEQLGYTYPRYFSSVFRQYMGVLPSKYRQDSGRTTVDQGE